MKFIVDTQLPPKLATLLSANGYESIHTTYFKDGHLLSDVEIISKAKAQDRIIVTKDSDFSDYYMLRGAPPKILLLELGNIKNSNLFSLFDKYLKEIILSFQDGNELVLFRYEEIIGY